MFEKEKPHRQFEIMFADWRVPLEQVGARVEEFGGNGGLAAWIAQLCEAGLYHYAFELKGDDPKSEEDLREMLLLGQAKTKEKPGRFHAPKTMFGYDLMLPMGKFKYVEHALPEDPWDMPLDIESMAYPLIIQNNTAVWPLDKVRWMRHLGLTSTLCLEAK